MTVTSLPTPNAATPARGAHPRTLEDLVYQMGTLGAILLVLSSLLIF